MDKKQQEALNRKRSNETFNSITQKVKPENQNQQHNARYKELSAGAECRPFHKAVPNNYICDKKSLKIL